eukprot:c3638_g1_i2.p1 GENE.c3638_g1_i2~~c3638_g1_i2.p1  ORF type:complete len:347 (+),score=75.74 c3638_g1_i2:45-1043(+)
MAGVRVRLRVITGFFILRIGLEAFQKHVTDEVGFSFPFLTALCNYFSYFVLCLLLSRMPSFYHRKQLSSANAWWTVGLISIFSIISLSLDTISSRALPSSTASAIRSTTPLVVILTARVLEQYQLNLPYVLSSVLVVAGTVQAVGIVGEHVTVLAVLGSATAVVANALFLSFISVSVGPLYRFGSLDVLLYTALPSMLLLLPFLFVGDEYRKILDYSRANGVNSMLKWIVSGQILSFLYNVSLISVIKILSSVYVSLCTVVCVVAVVIVTMINSSDAPTTLNAIGAVTAILAFVFTSVLEFHPNQSVDGLERDNDSDEEASLLGNKPPLTPQ